MPILITDHLANYCNELFDQERFIISD